MPLTKPYHSLLPSCFRNLPTDCLPPQASYGNYVPPPEDEAKKREEEEKAAKDKELTDEEKAAAKKRRKEPEW